MTAVETPTLTFDALTAAALRLPNAERVQLHDLLADSLDDEEDFVNAEFEHERDPDFSAHLDRIYQAHLDGTEPGTPMDVALKRVRDRLK